LITSIQLVTRCASRLRPACAVEHLTSTAPHVPLVAAGAQDETTSAPFGMPGTGLVRAALPLPGIAGAVLDHVRFGKSPV